jgi:hypothetical protein
MDTLQQGQAEKQIIQWTNSQQAENGLDHWERIKTLMYWEFLDFRKFVQVECLENERIIATREAATRLQIEERQQKRAQNPTRLRLVK